MLVVLVSGSRESRIWTCYMVNFFHCIVGAFCLAFSVISVATLRLLHNVSTLRAVFNLFLITTCSGNTRFLFLWTAIMNFSYVCSLNLLFFFFIVICWVTTLSPRHSNSKDFKARSIKGNQFIFIITIRFSLSSRFRILRFCFFGNASQDSWVPYLN